MLRSWHATPGLIRILRPITHRSVEAQQELTVVRARDVLVRLRTAAVNAVRGLVKPCGVRLPPSSTSCFGKRCQDVLSGRFYSFDSALRTNRAAE